MINNLRKRDVRRRRRSMRVRSSVRGSANKPRLTVSKTNRHIFAQLIDDDNSVTLVSAGTMQKGSAQGKTKKSARLIGKKIGELALKLNITRVVFDRGHLKYHGVLAELANGARETGIQF